jgi:hypothetical protein
LFLYAITDFWLSQYFIIHIDPTLSALLLALGVEAGCIQTTAPFLMVQIANSRIIFFGYDLPFPLSQQKLTEISETLKASNQTVHWKYMSAKMLQLPRYILQLLLKTGDDIS